MIEELSTGTQSNSPQDPKQSWTSAVEKAEELWRKASLEGDAAYFDLVLAKDFVLISHGGRIINRQEFLKSFSAGSWKIKSMFFKDMEIRPQGETAVVVGTIQIDGKFDNFDFQGATRISKVWAASGSSLILSVMHASDARVQVRWEDIVNSMASAKNS